MAVEASLLRRIMTRDLMDTMIRIGLIAALLISCLQIVAPFLSLMLWALILAVALYPAHRKLATRFGGRQGAAATTLVVTGLLLIGVPLVMLGSSFAAHVQDAYAAFENDAIHIKAPDPAIAEWPLVGKQIYQTWSAAADDLPAYIMANKEQLRDLSMRGLSTAASTAGSVALFLGSLIVAGIMMAYGVAGNLAMQRIFSRLTDPERGPRLQRLSTATVRSVATGVIGVAFIQALLLGIGFILAGIPAAGVLAFVVMLIGIAQLPALLVSLPAIGYIWWAGDGSTASQIAFTVYLLVAGMADNVLKPLLLGRGVDAPMPVILLGAIGGMVTSGIIGLFLGAVVLAVGYELFMEWVASDPNAADPSADAASDAAPPADAHS